ncbi:KATNB1-like protein 1 [Lingula anatina]|uniref:KATNB1-like protein 1 n=1 Tax=Lingula anatina TaxID=7574 RepID=A0A1S3JWV2_LINAN|nr:KATNB1-like protein 1 [Lingula anatina]|eukprot:XP_013414853.1 KATNB1-like protein 1 [Lingula anatina]
MAAHPPQNPGLINAGAGYLKWDVFKNKYVWLSKEEVEFARIKKEVAAKRASKRKSGEPNPYEANLVNEMKKIKLNQGKPLSYKVQGKKGIRPLAAHNARGSKEKAPCHPAQWPVSENHQQYDIAYAKENMPIGLQGEKGDGTFGREDVDELLAGHTQMLNVLNVRLLRLRAAQTIWHQQGASDVVSYLQKINNDSVTVDILPYLTKCIRDDWRPLSMGACMDLLPSLKKLLTSKFEDYIISSLDFIRAVLKKWWKEISSDHNQSGMMLRSRSVIGVYTSLKAMTDIVDKLSERTDRTGERARLVQVFLKQL